MIGILYYLFFLFLGFIYSKYLFKKNLYFHIWVGGILGNIMTMVGIVIPSMFLKFTIISHIVLIVLGIIPLVILLKKYGVSSFCKKIITFDKKGEMDNKIFFLLILPIFILIVILLTNHILVPTPSGGVASGQSTFGDLNMHLGFITSIAEQKVFPPNYPFLSGTRLNYPFFVNMLSSSLYILGSSLRVSILLPSYMICLLLIMGFYFLSYKITKNKISSILATVFFFFCGGLGFVYFIDGAKENINVFTRIFTEYYQTPTNLNELNIRWPNSICDMIIPQRTTMIGWCLILPCLWLLIDACKTNNLKSYIMLGILSSCLPMVHTHSFLALGVICIGMFFTYYFTNDNKKQFFKHWFIFGLIVLVLAFPQLFYWTFQQTSGNSNFVRFHFNWVNYKDNYLWFYLKNWGIVTLCLIPACLNLNKDNHKLMLSSLLLFILAEFILFQPNEYDNNKLIFISYMIFLIFCCDWLVYIYHKLKGVPGRLYLTILVIVISTLSGVLTIGREIYSGGKYETFTNDMIKMSNYIKENTENDAIFLTSTTHINPVSSLAGRNTYVGSSLYVYFHGFYDEYNKRSLEVIHAYESNYDELKEFCIKNNISYIYLGSYELGSLNPNWDTIDKLEKVVNFGNETLYKIKK